jgi:pyruvate dehydrogenase E2 component (dihydrolipoamide acetyltransferase)
MAKPILMPKPGQMTEECTIIAWLKAEGDPVAKGDTLFEIETDKSAMEVESWEEGVLLKQVVAAGETAPVNAVCAWVGKAGEAIPEVEAAVLAAAPAAVLAAAAAPAPKPAPVAPTAPAAPVPTQAVPVAASVAPAPAPRQAAGDRVPISPRASRLAASAGIDPRSIAGSGPGGRIVEKDVQAAIAAAKASPAQAAPAAPAQAAAAPVVQVPIDADASVEPMSRMRRVISDRLTHSWTTTPHFTVTVAVNMHRLFNLRTELKAQGTNLSVTDFILAATAQTLVEFPDVNTRVDGSNLVRRRHVHLGLAVSVTGGLLVPVIRDADLLSVTGIHDRSQALIQSARAGTLGPDELSGSTFSVSNLGMFEVEEFSAIINPGEGAILAVSSAVPTPVAVGEGIAVRPIMKLTLSADHRVVDGETAARFLGALRRRLEDADAFRTQVLLD